MKFLIIIFLALISNNSFAMDFVCHSKETGIGYRITTKTNSILLYEVASKKTIIVHHFEKVIVLFNRLGTSYSYANSNGIFMEIEKQGNKIVGSFDDDDALVCRAI